MTLVKVGDHWINMDYLVDAFDDPNDAAVLHVVLTTTGDCVFSEPESLQLRAWLDANANKLRRPAVKTA